MWVMRGLLRGTADAPDAKLRTARPGAPVPIPLIRRPNAPPECAARMRRCQRKAPRGPLAEPAVHVIGCPRVVGCLEDLLSRARFHDVPGRPVGGEEKRGLLRNAGGLLHVVGH